MDPLPRIPVPISARWNRWRWRLTHAVVFLGLCGGIGFFWLRVQLPAVFIGQVEAMHTTVSSRDDGFITNLWVAPLQEVKAGDLLAEVITTDPRTVNNRLEVMRDRMRLTQLEMDPILNRQRGALAYEQLGVDCAKIKAELEIARVNFEQAESQRLRDEKIFNDGLLSKDLYELSAVRAKAFAVEVAEKAKLVERTEKALERLQFMADAFLPGGENDPLRAALALEEERIRLFEGKALPLRLVAPTNGVVTMVHHHPGEQILAGQPIVTITCEQSERIVGFLPQNHPVEPHVGMDVEVRTRTTGRVRGCAIVTGVSPYLEPLTNSLVAPLVVRPVLMPPMGRVISISLPRGMHLLPGEPVDLSFTPQSPRSGDSGRTEK
jgi:multidrug resistance efflux pump